jgi:hypothetical protein
VNGFPDTVTISPQTEEGQFTCEIWSPKGLFVRVTGTAGDPSPDVSGDEALTRNTSLVQGLWSAASDFLQSTALKEDSPDLAAEILADARNSAEAAAELAELAERLGEQTTEGWCSNCVTLTSHHQVKDTGLGRDIFLCDSCGAAVMHCAAPNCTSMAVKVTGLRGIAPYCAEHRHDIASFERSRETIADLADWKALVNYEKPDLAKATTRATVGLAAVGAAAGGAWLAAPAIGGIIGTQFMALTGAAATNGGLAFLGGGAVAAGGLGMAGGTYAVATAGGLLGGIYGDRILGSYIGEDPSFKVEKLRDGSGTPVVIARGFLNENQPEWFKAVRAVQKRYPESPVYLLHWGSKEFKHLANALGVQAAGQAGKKFIAGTVARASKKMAKKVGPVAPALAVGDLLKNPWHTAVHRANRTGTALAALLGRTEQDEFILVGHSLGGRVMATAASAMAGFGAAPKIRDIHLVGAAISVGREWRPLSEAVTGTVHNYCSQNDPILRRLYRTAQLGQHAVGEVGFNTSFPNIVDHDVSTQVSDHSRYYDAIDLI